VESCRQPPNDRVLNPQLDILDSVAGIELVPLSIEGFGHAAELDNEVAGKVLRVEFAAFLAPQTQQGSFIAAHDNARVRAADESTTTKVFARRGRLVGRKRHDALPLSCSRMSSAAERITPSASAATSWNGLSRERRSKPPLGRCCAVSAMIALR